MRTLNLHDMLLLDPTLFQECVLDEKLDRGLVQESIIFRCGSLMPLYTDSKMLKQYINMWFRRKQITISQLIKTTEYNYNPIENYDRHEEIKRDNTVTAGINTTNTLNAGITQESQVSAFDSSDYSPDNRTINTGKDVTTVERKGSDTENEKTISHVHGNIGVTTTQEMLEAQRNIVQFDIYDWIAQNFEKDVCILV